MTNSIAGLFLWWFFAKAPLEILQLGRFFTIWAWQFFSIGFFIPRIFSPWHRDMTSYGRGFDFKRFFHVLGWNLIARVVGAILRLGTIVLGLAAEAAIAGLTVVSFLIWYLLPLVIIFLLFSPWT